MSEVVIDFDEIFNNFIEANQKKWVHDRSSTLGASEVFDCLRKGWFEKRGKEFGHEADEDYDEDWGAMTRGNLIENHHVVPAVRDHMPKGMDMLFTGDDQVTLVLDRNSATPDGLITGLPLNSAVRIKGGNQDILIENIRSDCLTFEIKSIDPRATLHEERAKHHGQTQVQLGLFNDKTKHKPQYAVILYIDASFLSKVTPFVIEYDPKIYAEARLRAADVWATDDVTEIMPEGRFSGSCQYCKWRRACGTATNGAIPSYEEDEQSTPETIEKMDGLVKKYEATKLALAKATEEEELAKYVIKEFLTSRNTRKMKSGSWSVSWFGSKGQRRLDSKALAADGVDLEPYMKEGNPFDVVRITPVKAKVKKV